MNNINITSVQDCQVISMESYYVPGFIIDGNSTDICMMLLERDVMNILSIKNPTFDMYKYVLTRKPEIIKYIKDPTEIMCIISLLHGGPRMIQNITNMTDLLNKFIECLPGAYPSAASTCTLNDISFKKFASKETQTDNKIITCINCILS